MKRLIVSTVCGAAMMLGTASATFAAPASGIPGQPNCYGHDVVTVNHFIGPVFFGTHGVGNTVEALGITVQQGRALLYADCASTP